MNQDVPLFSSAQLILDLNENLLQWLGAGYWLSLFAVGVAIWTIRFLLAHTLGPLGMRNELKNKALVNIIMGGVLCALIIVPVGQLPYVSELAGSADNPAVTPAAAFVKRVLADGSDFYAHRIVARAVTPGTEAEEPDESRLGQFVQDRLHWFSRLITHDLIGAESREELRFAAGDETRDATGHEDDVLSGFGNMVQGVRGTYDSVKRAAVLVFELLSSPFALISYAVGAFIVLVLGVWVNVLAFAFPFLFVGILFILPVSYLFDGTARVVPMIKLLVAFAVGKPLAMLFVTLGFAVIDRYMLGIFDDTGTAPLFTVFQDSFFNLIDQHAFSFPLVLCVALASAILALLAPVAAYLILGAEGGTLAGFVSSMYMYAATNSARLAGKAVTTVAGGVVAGPAGAAAGAAAGPNT